jgi:hypothetical protein
LAELSALSAVPIPRAQLPAAAPAAFKKDRLFIMDSLFLQIKASAKLQVINKRFFLS